MRLCLHLIDVALELNLPCDMCRWLVAEEDEEIVHEVLVKHHRLLTSFVEALRIAIASIAQACAVVNHGESNDLQRLEAPRPPMVRGRVDSRVRTTMTIEGGVDVIRGIQDMGVVLRGRKIQLLPTRERSRRLLFHKDIQDRAKVIRTKARMGHLVKQGLRCVIYADSLDTFDEIAHC